MASAAFTSIDASAALITVIRAEDDRRRQTQPNMHVDAVHDHRDGQANFRVTVTNEGGAAFDVKVMGTEGPYGFYGVIPPTAFWRSGEQRIFHVSMPPGPHTDQTQLLVPARDASRQNLHAVTAWGERHR